MAGIASALAGGAIKGAAASSAFDGFNFNAGDLSGGASLKSSMQGPTPPIPGAVAAKEETTPSSLIGVIQDAFNKTVEGLPSNMSEVFLTSVSQSAGRSLGRSAGDRGRDQRDYLASAYPELNPWERSGASAPSTGGAMSQEQASNSIATQQMDMQKKIAGLNAVTSRMNNKEQTYAQNTLVSARREEIKAHVFQMIASGNVSKQQVLNYIADEKLKTAQTIESYARTSMVPFAMRESVSRARNNDARTSGQTWVDELNQERADTYDYENRYTKSRTEGQDLSNELMNRKLDNYDPFGDEKGVDDLWDDFKRWNRSGSGRR